MELRVSTFLILCPLVFLAGFVDAVAGGGGLISLPAYLISGCPLHFVLGTNKLSSSMGTMAASIRYYRNRCVDLRLCLPSIALALAGSFLGSNLTLRVQEAFLQKILLVLLPITALYVFKRKDLSPRKKEISPGRAMAAALIVSFVIGCYDGFFGPGAGTFLILLFTGIAGMEARIANGNGKFVNLASNIAALGVFFYHRRVILPLGLCAGLFNILGAYLGSGLAIRRGGKIIRYFILGVLVLLFAKTAWDFWHP